MLYSAARMRWNYTKTMLLIVACKFALGFVVSLILWESPFKTGGTFWIGLNVVTMGLTAAVVMDSVAALRWACRSAFARRSR